MRHLRLASVTSLVFFAVACTEAPAPIEPEAHAHTEEALFTNSGFESGNLNGWTTSTALVASSPGVQAYPVTQESQLGLRTGGVAKTSAVNAPGGPYSLIPPGMTAAETARYPRFGNWAAVVNDQGAQYNANKITQSSVVTTADIDPADGLVHVRFVVLPVLQNPGHTVREQPYYYVAINNVTKGTQLTSRFNFSNEAGVPWQSNANGSIVYTDWLLFDLPLSRNAVSIGDTLQAVIIAGGCAQSGHWGEAIIDSFGSTIPGLVAYGAGPDSVEAGSDFQYTYRVLNGSTATSTGTELTAYLPAGTTFRSVDTAGITCTTPTVGTRGTVSCNLGAIGAGASTTVKITVRADATATGEIRHGWYFSKSNQEKPLTGPLVTTKVTTGGTTQYVDLVTTVDDATTSLTWGQQQNTWAITVLNRGPTTATNARLVTNTPANLNTLTWTCTAQTGASCGTASGTGAIDALATIPAGKSVTWSLKANVNAGLGTGMVSVTATASAPTGTTEQYALDNGSGDDDTLSLLVLPVTVKREGAGTGELIATPAGLSCGTSCSQVSGNFASGTQVTINAVPAAGSMFMGWSGGTCSGTASCTFTTTLSHTVTGTFEKIPTLITSPATANAAVGRPFSYTVTANGTAPIALTAANLPAWATFNPSTGVISGTPPATGSATINLSAADVNGTATQSLVITIGTAPTITSALYFSVASAGSGWGSVVVTATGSASIQYNASNLPGTVYFNSTTGAFAGSSGANGVFNIPVVATNAFGSDYKTIAVSVGSAPVITSSLNSSATVGTAWTYQLTATPSGVTLSASNLPSWATFNASSGVISGTPTTAGTLNIGVAATNSVGTSNQTLVLTVDGPAVITSALTANGTAGQAFAYTLTAEGTTPITRAVTGLQSWMSFDASSGLISGTPPAPGTFTVNLAASNAIGSDTRTLTITIAAPPPTPTPPAINSALAVTGAVGAPFTYTITAAGAVPMTFAATGLPGWASFDAATGTITGTPSTAGGVSVGIKATNSLGEDNKTLTINIVSPPAITSALTAIAVVGDSFSYTTTASGTGPITFTATGVPAWASFSGGVLTGTPTAEGDVTVALRAENQGGSDTKNLVIAIRTRPLITSSLNAEGTVGTAFSYTVTASGSAPRTLTTGALPSWASFNAATGVISGTPTSEGPVSISLGVSNAAGTDSKSLNLVIRKRAEVTSASTADAVVGELFSYTMTATGTAPLTLSATGLPAWLAFNASTGVLSGTPTASGSQQVSLTADNAAGSDTRTLTITIRTKPSITSALTADAIVGEAFTYTASASGTAPLSWSATGLPAWATLNAATGAITGTPTSDVNATISLTVTNAAGSNSQTVVITVRAKPLITSTLTADAVVGEAFTYTASATGTAPSSWSATGLPAWATLNPSTGAITGTPTSDVNATIALTVTNAAGSNTKNVVITVRAKPVITSVGTADAVVGEAFSYTVTATGTAPRTSSVSGLPAWASFNAGTGVISGTPTSDVNVTISMTVTNAAGSNSKNLVVTVRAKPSITSQLTADAVVGEAFSYTVTASGTAPRTLSVSGLPAWASFNASTGVITGTPTGDVNATIALTVTNDAGSNTKNLVVTVRAKPAITSALTAIATVGESFSYTVTASGTAPRTLSVSGLPTWASFDASTGLITGTPTSDVNATIALSVTNAAGTDTKNLVITVRAKPSITSALTAVAIVGEQFSYTATATGTEPRTLTVTGLPSWASFTNGVITGTPDADVNATIALTVTNAAGTDTKNLVVTVRAKPAITSQLTAIAIVDESFNYQVAATGTEPRTLSVSGLPSWASFNATTGIISGTPNADVNASLVLTVTNAAGTDSKTLELTVRAKPAITSATQAEAVVGQPFTFAVTTTGTAPLTLSASGLPSWLSFDASTGVLSGTAPSDEDATIVFTVTNAAGTASKSLQLTVRAKPFITSGLTADAIVGLPFSYTLTAAGTAPLTLATGMLPAWLSYDAATGVLSGIPSADGQETVLISVSNAAGSETKSLVITARTLPVFTNVSSLNAVQGEALSLTLTATGTNPMSFTATNLPAGVSLVNGVITGTPTMAGHYEVQVTATNGAGQVTTTVVIDVRAPLSTPVITAPIANATLNNGMVVISGTIDASEAGGTVIITDGTTQLCTATIEVDGSWRCTATLLEGSHEIVATLTDANGFEGSSSGARDFIVDVTAPGGLTVSSPGGLINTALPTFSGTGEVGATVTVERNGYTVCVAIVGANGSWSCTPSMPLPEGASAIAIVQRDVAGNASNPVVINTTVDVTAPVMPSMTSPVAGSIMGNTLVNFTGTAEAGSTVTVFVDGVERCSAVADSNGRFSCSAMLGDGGHQVTVTSTDAAGNSTSTTAMNMLVDTTAPSAPMLSQPIGGITTPAPTFSGTGEPGASIRVLVDGQQVCMTTVSSNGTWSCTVSPALSEGVHQVSITATDAAGHQSQSVDGSIDVRGSTGAVTTITGTVGSNDNGHVEGTATPGATVNVYVDGQLVGTVTADANGHWGFDLPLLGAGEHTVSIGVVGKDGRETPAGETVLVVTQASFDVGGGGLGCSTSSGSPTWIVALLVLGALWRRGAKKVATVAVAAVATTVSAQQVEVSGFDLEQLYLNPGARSGLVVGGGDVLLPMDFRVAASLGYQHAPLVYFADGERQAALVENRLTTTLSGAFGVLPWLEVGASVPLVVFQNGQSVTSSRGDMIANGVSQQVSFGTPWLQGRVAPFQERDGAPLDLGVTLGLGIPLGATGSLTSEPYVTGQVLVGAARTVGPVRVAVDLGALIRAERTIAVNDVIGSRLLGGVGVSTISGPLRGELSFRGFIPLAGETASAEVLGGARYSFGDFEVFGLAGPGIGNSPGTPAFRALLGVSFGGVKSGRCTSPSTCAAAVEPIKKDEPVAAPPVVAVVAPAKVVEAAPPAVTEEAPVAPAPEPAAEAVPQVELKNDRIEIQGTVHFESGRAVIGAASFMVLNEVASLLNAHPEVKRVRVEGHTDDRGGAAANLKLSTARAAAVREYLVKQGVAADRLTSKGFGQTQPVMSNETAAGREKNRRVMFTIEQ
ncbi:MAG: putative Ig domain-containing protein [Archangium sp.]